MQLTYSFSRLLTQHLRVQLDELKQTEMHSEAVSHLKAHIRNTLCFQLTVGL